MRFTTYVCAVFLAVLLGGCATPYGEEGFTGGYDAKNLEGDIWRISFGGNGYSNPETVQSYWLYRCAELAIDKGFDGFEILSPIKLTSADSESDDFGGKIVPAAMIYVPMYMDSSPHPSLTADIRFIKKPITVELPKVFDARELKAALEPYVKGEKCDLGNVCPHVHSYLYSVEPRKNPV